MKLITFKNGFHSVIAHRITRNDVSHFNLKHGTRLASGWEVTMGVDDAIVSRELETKDYKVELSDDDYILLPIYAKGTTKTIRDARGNKKFFISVDSASSGDKVLLFLHLPKVSGVQYELHGGATTISLGAEVLPSIEFDNEIIESPVILLDGDSAIAITYLKDDEQVVERIIFANGEIRHVENG